MEDIPIKVEAEQYQVLKDRMDKTVAGQSVEQHLMVMFEAKKEQMGL